MDPPGPNISGEVQILQSLLKYLDQGRSKYYEVIGPRSIFFNRKWTGWNFFWWSILFMTDPGPPWELELPSESGNPGRF